MRKPRLSWRTRAYFFCTKLLNACLALLHAGFVGFWLGVLRHSDLQELDGQYYDRQGMYGDDSYQRSGLFKWEREAIERHFSGCRNIVLTAAGSGREVLALCRMGFAVDAFECNPLLAARANALLSEVACGPTVTVCERDVCPTLTHKYDGAVVGWGSFMLIPGRHRRIRFLQDLRKALDPGAPVLLSFFALENDRGRLTAATMIGNAIRRVRRAELLDPRDDLCPNYVHRFTRDEIEKTMAAAGFRLAYFDSVEYGHAVGLATRMVAEEREAEVLQR
jgi:hypothetical protein